MNTNTVQITLEVDDKGTPKIKEFSETTNKSVGMVDSMKTSWTAATATAGHTAAITDASDRSLFNERCVTQYQSVMKYFYGHWVGGIKIASSGVGSGKILITYK